MNRPNSRVELVIQCFLVLSHTYSRIRLIPEGRKKVHACGSLGSLGYLPTSVFVAFAAIGYISGAQALEQEADIPSVLIEPDTGKL